MNGTEKAPADAATLAGTTAEATGGTGTTTKEQYSTAAGCLARYLRCGSEHAISTAELMELTGCANERMLRESVEKERFAGVPILTKGGKHGGYFLPSADADKAIVELENFIRLQKGKGIGCLRSMKPARRLLAELKQRVSGQEEMEL